MAFYDDNTQDVSGLPVNDELAKLQLQQRLKMAQALQEQQVAQGQMVGNRYVAPSWTQHLANMAGKVVGGMQEREALDKYGEYQKTKAQKYGTALDELYGKLAPKEVEQYADYNESGNMPLVETKMQQPTATDLTQALLKFGKDTNQPEVAQKAVMSRIEAMNKDKGTPIKGSAGDVFFDPVTHEEVFSVPGKTKENSLFSKIEPHNYTPESVAKFSQSNNYADLVSAKPEAAPVVRNMRQGSMELTQQWDPQTKAWKTVAQGPAFKPESDSAKDTLVFNRTNKLRDDFSSLPEVKAWNVIQPTLVSARQAAKDTSGGSDLNLIYAMGKIMDPNSVVREGELQLAGNTGSYGQRIMGLYKSVASGGKLPPTVKQDLLNQIESRAKSQQMLYENTKKRYSDIAKRNQLNPEDLFVPGITEPSSKSVSFGDLK